MNPTLDTAEPASTSIGGAVRRIAIVTVRRDPCACYLARRLRDSGADIALVSQRRPRIEPDSWAYYRRLLRVRGVACAADNFLLFVVKRLAALPALVRGRRAGAAPAAAVLRPDPDIAHEGWLTHVEVDDVNRPPDQDRLRDLAPDLMLLAGAPILSSRTIALAKVACINTHCGITPDYAGSSPVVWPLREGRPRDIGFTIHLVVPKVDSGPILCQQRVEWEPSMSLSRIAALVTQRMYDKLADVALELIRGERLDATPQASRPVKPPAGLSTRVRAEWARRRLAAGRRTARPPRSE